MIKIYFSDCPTCSQYQALEKQVQEMYNMYKNISEKVRMVHTLLADIQTSCNYLELNRLF
jgi:hypothetical protein